MNLIDEENIKKRGTKKYSGLVVMVIVILSVLMISLCAMLYVVLVSNTSDGTIKISIDTEYVTGYTDTLFIQKDSTIYVSIPEMSKMLGYEVYKGDHISESTTKGYIKNEYEESSYSLNSNKIFKTLTKSTDNEYFYIDTPVIMENEILYISLEGIQLITNSKIIYNEETTQFTIYSLDYLNTYYAELIENSAIIDKDFVFSNSKALLYDRIIVKNDSGDLGIQTLEGVEILGTKFKSITFIESSGDFIIKTSDNKMGIMTIDGQSKITPQFDDIKQLDQIEELYLVKSNNKYGVINENGNIVIYLEYDQIGIPTTYTDANVDNQYLLYNTVIPAKRDNKWGLFNTDGEIILEFEYDAIGCNAGSKTVSSTNHVVVVPKYECIVVCLDKKYGLVNKSGKVIMLTALDTVYSVTNQGKEEFYMQYEGEVFDLLDYIATYVVESENQPNQELEIEPEPEVDVELETEPELELETEELQENITEEENIIEETTNTGSGITVSFE